MKIFPVRPILRDFIRNAAYMRGVLFALFLLLVANGMLLYVVEDLQARPGQPRGLLYWIAVSLDDFAPPGTMNAMTQTALGSFLRKISALAGFIVLGLVIWMVEHAATGHTPKKPRFFFFASKEDA